MVINPNDYSESYLNARLTHFVRRVHCARRQLVNRGFDIANSFGYGVTYNSDTCRWEVMRGARTTCFGVILMEDSPCSHTKWEYTSNVEKACSMPLDSINYGFYYGYNGASLGSLVASLYKRHWTVDACYWIGRYFRDLNTGCKTFDPPTEYPKLSHLFKAPA